MNKYDKSKKKARYFHEKGDTRFFAFYMKCAHLDYCVSRCEKMKLEINRENLGELGFSESFCDMWKIY